MSRNILTDSASWQPVVDDVDMHGPADGSEPTQFPENRTQEKGQSAPGSSPVAGQIDLRATMGAKRSQDAAKTGRADEM